MNESKKTDIKNGDISKVMRLLAKRRWELHPEEKKKLAARGKLGGRPRDDIRCPCGVLPFKTARLTRHMVQVRGRWVCQGEKGVYPKGRYKAWLKEQEREKKGRAQSKPEQRAA